jgi:PAS domain S-box-containing protein
MSFDHKVEFKENSVTLKSSSDDYEQIFKFFEYTPDLLCIASYDGYFKKINPSVSKVLGYTIQELYSTKIMELVHPDDREATIAHRTSIIKDRGDSRNFQNRYIKKDGSYVWLSWTSVVYPDLECVFAIAKDITEQKELEQDKNNLLSDLLSANKRLEHFAKVASHDLRAPIINIISLFDFIEEDKIPHEGSLDIINLIKKSTIRVQETLEKYINDITIVEGNKENKLQNLEKITTVIINSVSESLKNANATVSTNFKSYNKIIFKKNYLESIIQNLITNAVKYASPSRPLNLQIYTQIENGVRQLVFNDNGLGMDMSVVKDKIFKMNQTFHQNRESKGVGLYLVKSQLEVMNASISVESKVNVGTTFTISFAKD